MLAQTASIIFLTEQRTESLIVSFQALYNPEILARYLALFCCTWFQLLPPLNVLSGWFLAKINCNVELESNFWKESQKCATRDKHLMLEMSLLNIFSQKPEMWMRLYLEKGMEGHSEVGWDQTQTAVLSLNCFLFQFHPQTCKYIKNASCFCVALNRLSNSDYVWLNDLIVCITRLMSIALHTAPNTEKSHCTARTVKWIPLLCGH